MYVVCAQAVVTGLSSGTVYEFRVAAVTTNGTSPLSNVSDPITTIKMRKNEPIFVKLQKRVQSKKEAERNQASSKSTVPTLPILAHGHGGNNTSIKTGLTGLTPRFENDEIIDDTALSFDHTHGRPSTSNADKDSTGTVNADAAKLTLATGDRDRDVDRPVESEVNSEQQVSPETMAAAAADEKRRTLAAKDGRNLPYVFISKVLLLGSKLVLTVVV